MEVSIDADDYPELNWKPFSVGFRNNGDKASSMGIDAINLNVD